MLSDPTVMTLMYFVVPLWLLAGFADWLCHRASHIATTTGAKESLIHLLMFTEVGVPLVAVLFPDVNAGIILLMIGSFLVHEATALWDVSYATTAREVTPIEQHVHSFSRNDPVDGHCGDCRHALGPVPGPVRPCDEPARFGLVRKAEPLPMLYVAAVFAAVVLFEFLPYFEELARGLVANRGALVPPKARQARR
jgi:hypothetical protein